MSDFQQFLDAHSIYKNALDRLARSAGRDYVRRLLVASARLVYRTHPTTLGPVADEILAFVEHDFPRGYIDRYLARIRSIAALQRRFDTNPCARTLGNPSAVVDEEAYSLALLLSIVFTNHRFEIMEQLRSFLRGLGSSRRSGRLAAVGVGSGYEMACTARALPDWHLEAYDSDEAIRHRAKRLWDFFGISRIGKVEGLFPLTQHDASFVERYDAIILCELCEHLPDPLRALVSARDYLKSNGRAFVTMAINLAQEDHLYLYRTPQDCRTQLRASGLEVLSEWLTPQSFLSVPARTDEAFQKGNYVGVVRKL